MVLAYYWAMLGIALALAIFYCYIFHKHFDVNITILLTLIPVCNLAFLMLAMSNNLEEAVLALKLTYISGCFVLPAAMFLIFGICGMPLNKWIRCGILVISTLVFLSALSIGKMDFFYESTPTFLQQNGASYLVNRDYGPMHTVFYVMVGLYYAATLFALIYCFFKKKQVPHLILIYVVIALTISVIGFFGGRLLGLPIELLPLTHNIGLILYIMIASRLRLYDASDSVTDSIVEEGETGFVSFSSKMRYLGSNTRARQMIPELSSLVIDRPLEDEWLKEHFLPLMEAYQNDNSSNQALIEKNGRYYALSLTRLMVGRWSRGYQFLIVDDTVNQEHLVFLRDYQAKLEEEVAIKTRSILQMQDKLVLGMATMVEGRDNSTGGHIKRTSDCIAILIGEMVRMGDKRLTPSFCSCLIKAAPMHDLGKIVVDDAILRKPGRFTPEEFAIMKTHAPEGARIVAKILEGIEDKEFFDIAVNVAHYHHERFDGSGYPEGIKGEEIPLEARIMAIVDVYDALVSKRVYKPSMSFEQAHSIIMEGMGSQFDPSLEVYYLAAKEKLEEYYKNLTE